MRTPNLLLTCDCGTVHEVQVLYYTHAADTVRDLRVRARAQFRRLAGWKQKVRLHCKCGRRIEAVFTDEGNRR